MNAECCPCSKFTDTDSDGIMDLTDPDSDGDGIPDATEGTVDTDGDGIPDYVDPASESTPVPDEEPVTEGKSNGDPHLHFAHGGEADFRGQNDKCYAFFSAPGLAVNVKVEESTFTLRGGKVAVNGSYLTEAHVVASVDKGRREATASFYASELDVHNMGWEVVRGNCAGRTFKFGKNGYKGCFELEMRMGISSAIFTLRNWTVNVHGNFVYGWVSGPKHRIDVSLSARGDAAARSLPHGLVGQSFSSTAPRHGKKDLYPIAGSFKTSAQAEGAIEGSVSNYELAGPYSTAFTFSRYDGKEAEAPQPEPEPVDASSVEENGN